MLWKTTAAKWSWEKGMRAFPTSSGRLKDTMLFKRKTKWNLLLLPEVQISNNRVRKIGNQLSFSVYRLLLCANENNFSPTLHQTLDTVKSIRCNEINISIRNIDFCSISFNFLKFLCVQKTVSPHPPFFFKIFLILLPSFFSVNMLQLICNLKILKMLKFLPFINNRSRKHYTANGDEYVCGDIRRT